VTFVLDRAGVTGSDGASHNGMWDMAIGSIVPGLRLAAPRDGDQVRRQLREAVDVSDGPTVLRFPKGDVAEPIAALERWGSLDVLHGPGTDPVDLLLVGVGSMASTAVGVAEKLEAQGRSVRVVDPRWVLPVSDDLVEAARAAGAVAVVEDNLVSSGIGAAVTVALRAAGLDLPVHLHGIPKEFLEHASRSQVLEQVGLTADSIATSLAAALPN
jgi:1-deoxy-D-xylulose-5-phosphate synthase